MTDAAAEPRRRRSWLRIVLELSVLVLVLVFVWRSLVEALHQLKDYKFHLQPGWLALSGLLYVLGMLSMAIFWYFVLRSLGQHPRWREALRAYYVSQLGKYVPGKAMVVVLRAGMIHGDRVSAGVAAASVFVETLTFIAVGAFLAAGILALAPLHPEVMSKHGHLLMGLAAGLMVVVGVPTLPPVFRRLALWMRIGRSDPDVARKLGGLKWRLMACGWLGAVIGWVLVGLSLWATLRAMGIAGLEPVGHLQYYVAAAAMAVVAGFVSMLPGGALVREMVLMAILGVYFSKVIGANPEQANPLVTAVLLRLVWLAAELVVAGIVFVALRDRRRFETLPNATGPD